jgi:hypothetical protein
MTEAEHCRRLAARLQTDRQKGESLLNDAPYPYVAPQAFWQTWRDETAGVLSYLPPEFECFANEFEQIKPSSSGSITDPPTDWQRIGRNVIDKQLNSLARIIAALTAAADSAPEESRKLMTPEQQKRFDQIVQYRDEFATLIGAAAG